MAFPDRNPAIGAQIGLIFPHNTYTLIPEVFQGEQMRKLSHHLLICRKIQKPDHPHKKDPLQVVLKFLEPWPSVPLFLSGKCISARLGWEQSQKKCSVRVRSTATNIFAQVVCEERAKAVDSDKSIAMSRGRTAYQPDNSVKTMDVM